MAKPLRDVAPKAPKEGEYSGVKKSKTETMDIADLNAAPGNQDFAKKHKIEKHEDRVGNGDDVYKGKTKQMDMTRHGHKSPADEKIYEAKCNMTEAGTLCEVHGDKDCSVPEAKPGKRGMLADKKKLDEVLTKKTPAKEVISDFVHSKNKMFKGDSKKQRIKRALGAYYGMQKEGSDPLEKNLPPISQDGVDPKRTAKFASMVSSQPGKTSEPTQTDREKATSFESGGKKKKIKEDLAMPMLEGGKKKKTQKESAPGETPMRFPSGNVGDTGRV